MSVALLLEAATLATKDDVKSAAAVVIIFVLLGVGIVCTYCIEIKKLLEKK